MSKKRVKIFKSGTYPQGDYPPERVKNIFTSATKSDAIFIHSSKWQNATPPKIGEFSNFQIVEKDGVVDVFADIQLNEKGEVYHSDKIFKGISVEIPNDTLKKIALLPLGINPAVSGAEFEEGAFITPLDLEFEEDIQKMNFESTLTFIIGAELTVDQMVKLMRALQTKVTDKQAVYTLAREFAAERVDIGIIEEVKTKTPAEIEKEFEERFNKRLEAKEFSRNFMEKNNNKITPAMKNILTSEKLEALYLSNNNSFEFEGKEQSVLNLVEGLFEKMPQILKEGQIITEFETKLKEETPQEYAARIHGE